MYKKPLILFAIILIVNSFSFANQTIYFLDRAQVGEFLNLMRATEFDSEDMRDLEVLVEEIDYHFSYGNRLKNKIMTGAKRVLTSKIAAITYAFNFCSCAGAALPITILGGFRTGCGNCPENMTKGDTEHCYGGYYSATACYDPLNDTCHPVQVELDPVCISGWNTALYAYWGTTTVLGITSLCAWKLSKWKESSLEQEDRIIKNEGKRIFKIEYTPNHDPHPFMLTSFYDVSVLDNEDITEFFDSLTNGSV